MKKTIFSIITLLAMFCACTKEEIDEPGYKVDSVIPEPQLVFTATMEGAPESKAIFDNTVKCASWEVGDLISINGLSYKAHKAGTSTTFSLVGSGSTCEMRPMFISSTDSGSYQNQPASNLVDDAGTATRWIADKTQRYEGVWNIVVSTGSNTLLKTIKLWNADNQSYPNRRWKHIRLYGRSTSSEAWQIIDSYDNLNLAINNKGFAGEIEVNSSTAYTFYKINVLDNEGDSYMQMSDMTFTVEQVELVEPYYAYFPVNLYDGYTASLPSSVSETWTEGKFNMPMYAKSNTTDLEFKNLCGVLKITVKKESFASVKSIRISSSNKATSGAFTVTDNTAVLKSPNTSANTVTVTYTDAVTTSDEGTVFYIAIPAQTYQNLMIELSSDGVNFSRSITTTKDTNITVARSRVYSINFTDVINSKSRGKAKATINGQEVDVDWIQLWEDGPKFAKFNIGAENNNETDYGNYYRFDDAKNAVSQWGNVWRMPDKTDFEKLLSKCIISETRISSVSGWLITGEGEYSKNNIFLPDTGHYNFSSRRSTTFYWATPKTMKSGIFYASGLEFLWPPRMSEYLTECKCPVRAVLAE